VFPIVGTCALLLLPPSGLVQYMFCDTEFLDADIACSPAGTTSAMGQTRKYSHRAFHFRCTLSSGHSSRHRGWQLSAINGLMHRSKRTHAGCNASLDHPSAATRPARGNPTTSKAACVFMPERCRCNGASAAMNLLRLCRDECHKAIPVRHAYLRQRLGIHRVVLSDDAVELQDVGGHCIEFVIGQRLGFVVRH
jgi:hypothetical protein